MDWTPLERALSAGDHGPLLSAIITRRRRFDSALVEPGPPAMLTNDGILLLYNGANRQSVGDQQLPEMAYLAGRPSSIQPIPRPSSAGRRRRSSASAPLTRSPDR